MGMEELSEWFPQFYPITGLGQSGAVSPEYRFMPCNWMPQRQRKIHHAVRGSIGQVQIVRRAVPGD